MLEHQVSLLSLYFQKLGAVWVSLNGKWYYMLPDFSLYEDYPSSKHLVWPTDFERLRLFAENVFRVLHVGLDKVLLPEQFYIQPMTPALFSGIALLTVLEDVKYSQVKVGKILVRGTGLFSITMKKLAYNRAEVRDFRFGPNAPVIYGEML